MKLGVDISTHLEELAHGAKYYDGDKQIDPLDLLSANGVEIVRLRLWVDPYGFGGQPYLAGTCDLECFLRLGALVQSKGYKIMLDIHYSDFWADPAKQTVPKSWAHLDSKQLVTKVYEYTVQVLTSAKAKGLDIAYIQVGNEITNGMLWPHGRLVGNPEEGTRKNYAELCEFLRAGCKGCREIYPDAAIVLHLERSFDTVTYDEFFTHMAEEKIDYDIIGYSYYPYWHGTMDMLYRNIDFCRKFGKRQMIVELSYAFTLEDYVPGESGLVVCKSKMSELKDFTPEYPLTPEGQAAFTREFLSRAQSHGIEAVFWWEPLWIPGEGICWASEAGQEYIGEQRTTRNEWSNQCFFDYEGKKLPVVDAFSAKADGKKA